MDFKGMAPKAYLFKKKYSLYTQTLSSYKLGPHRVVWKMGVAKSTIIIIIIINIII